MPSSWARRWVGAECTATVTQTLPPSGRGSGGGDGVGRCHGIWWLAGPFWGERAPGQLGESGPQAVFWGRGQQVQPLRAWGAPCLPELTRKRGWGGVCVWGGVHSYVVARLRREPGCARLWVLGGGKRWSLGGCVARGGQNQPSHPDSQATACARPTERVAAPGLTSCCPGCSAAASSGSSSSSCPALGSAGSCPAVAPVPPGSSARSSSARSGPCG